MEKASGFVPNECGGRVDDGVDRISQLPDEILFVILSFLRLKEAAATSVLSSQWSDLWRHTPNLDFNRDILPRYYNDHYFDSFDNDDDDDSLWDAHRCKFIEIVNLVVQSHKAFCLKRFILNVPGNTIAQCTITKWLEFVFSRQVESLVLGFDVMDDLVLEELLRESRICLQPQTELIFFQSLKRLSLGCLRVSGEDIKLFLCDCPLLEHLTIHYVTLTSDVEVIGEKLSLKHLTVHCCKGEKSIKISAPNLTYMNFYNRRGVKVLVENVPKLVEARVKLVEARVEIGGSDLLQHLAAFPNCRFSS